MSLASKLYNNNELYLPKTIKKEAVKMDNKQLLIIILAIIAAGLIISIGCFYGLSQNNMANTTNATNSTNATNATNTTNVTVVEHISSDSQVESQSQSSSSQQYIGEDGEPMSEADYKTLQVYGKSADSPEEWEQQKNSLGY